jgi:hypothetical protein
MLLCYEISTESSNNETAKHRGAVADHSSLITNVVFKHVLSVLLYRIRSKLLRNTVIVKNMDVGMLTGLPLPPEYEKWSLVGVSVYMYVWTCTSLSPEWLDELQSHFGCVYQPVSGEYEHLAPKI